MRVSSKTILKFGAGVCIVYQGLALYLGQTFEPASFCSGLAALFATNSLHENFERWTGRE